MSLEPRDPSPAGVDWYGTVLIDPDTFQILRAEGYQHKNFEEQHLMQEMLEAEDDIPRKDADRTFVELRTRTEFNYAAHGIRLPTKVETRVFHHVVIQPASKKYTKKHLAFEITQRYKHYEFYGVKVAESH